MPVVCDLSDVRSARRAAAEIIALDFPVAGLANNAGIMPARPGRSAQGWDLAFATNHLGPFAFTEALIPHLPDGANIVFTCSGVEDPEPKPVTCSQRSPPRRNKRDEHHGTTRIHHRGLPGNPLSRSSHNVGIAPSRL